MEEIPKGKKRRLPLPVWGAALFVLVFCSLFSYYVFERIPHVNDEIAYLFQAKLFQSGRLFASSPCAKESFDFPHIINNGKWYSIYPPGFPFLLLIGLLLRAPWLINPLLAAAAIILFYFLGKTLYNRSVGILASILGAVSPWYLLMSSTMMSHTSSLFFNAFFLLFLFHSIKRPSGVDGLVAGAALGMATLTRPANALLFCLPFLIYYASHLLKDGRTRIKNLAAILGSAIPFFLVLFLYNFLTNGHPFRMGYLARYGKSYSVIFGRAATMNFEYTPLYAAGQIADNIRALNSELFGWPVSSFLAILPLFWLSRLRPEDRKKDLLLGSAIVWMFISLYFFWGAFVFIGARMFFDVLPLMLLLSARGIFEFPGLACQISKKFHPGAVRAATAAVLTAFVIYAFAYHFPRYLSPGHRQWYFDRYDHKFAGTTARIDRAIQEQNLGRALVVMKFLGRSPGPFPEGGWGSGFLYNDPDLRRNIIYARNLGVEDKKLFSCFPGRSFYLYLGTLEKGMLVPMAESEGAIVYGKPLISSPETKKEIKLVEKPQLLFKLYSKEFTTFLDRLYEERSFADVDTDLLRELGMLHQKNERFEEAAFCFEAALQIENNPEMRRALLDRIVPCYLKTGQGEEARSIQKFMERIHSNERELYSIFPERGF